MAIEDKQKEFEEEEKRLEGDSIERLLYIARVQTFCIVKVINGVFPSHFL